MPRAPEYIPGAPLYAREPMKFSGVAVAIGQPIPERPERLRRKLWENLKATHVAPMTKGAPPAPPAPPSKRRRR